jgi:hypothetical protein
MDWAEAASWAVSAARAVTSLVVVAGAARATAAKRVVRILEACILAGGMVIWVLLEK